MQAEVGEDMNSQSIRVFLAIVEHKSISDAARALYFSQSAVSQSLNQLEKELGVQLVFRGRGARQVKLTPAGVAFLPLARRRQELDAQIQQFMRAQTRKTLRLAANATAHQFLVPEIAQNLMQRSAGLELRLVSSLNRTILTDIENGLFDAAFFTGTASASHSLTAFPFFQAECCLLCSADTILPDRPISPQELDPRAEITHKIFSYRQAIQEWHRQHFPADVPPRMQTSAFMSLDNYLTDPRCWALIPLPHALYFVSRKPTLLTIRHIDPIPCYNPYSIIISKAYRNTDVIQDFLQCCREYLENRPYLINCLPE